MSNSPKSTANRTEGWDACDAGTLSGLGQRLQREHVRVFQRRFAGGALAATAAAALVVALWPASPPSPSPTVPNWPGGIACDRCLELMPAYHDKLVSADTEVAANLSAVDAEAVAAHLEGCPICREHFEEVYPGALGAAAATAGVGLLGFATRRFARG